MDDGFVLDDPDKDSCIGLREAHGITPQGRQRV